MPLICVKIDQTLLNNWYAHPETGYTADNVSACSVSDDEWRPIPLWVPQRGSEQFVAGLNDGKYSTGAYPQMINWIWVRGSSWPLHNIDPFLIQVPHDDSGGLWSGIILHQYEIWPHNTGEKSRNWIFSQFTSVSLPMLLPTALARSFQRPSLHHSSSCITPLSSLSFVLLCFSTHLVTKLSQSSLMTAANTVDDVILSTFAFGVWLGADVPWALVMCEFKVLLWWCPCLTHDFIVTSRNQTLYMCILYMTTHKQYCHTNTEQLL